MEDPTCTNMLMAFFKFILENNLDDVLSEITKLIKILLTIPMTTSEPDSRFSILKRIKTFLWSTISQERLNAPAVFATENRFLTLLQTLMKKLLIFSFKIKQKRMDFTFK